MPKIYRTMQGDQVDIEALFHRNELTQAVGNMRVNARGDELGNKGEVVKTKEQRAKEYYDRMTAPKRGPGRPRKFQEEELAPLPATEVEKALAAAGVTKEQAADIEDLDGDVEKL